mgnify:CR=1 FL=1
MTCAVTYGKTMENGLEKSVTEKYLVDALSFTEAEARIIEEIQPIISGELKVSGINRAHYSEVFLSDDGSSDKFYKVRIGYFTLDEKTGSEKRTIAKMLVQAGNFEGALRNFENGMKWTLVDYEIMEISETPIMDVYEYKAKED